MNSNVMGMSKIPVYRIFRKIINLRAGSYV